MWPTKVLRAAESGQLRLLYVAPEKLGASHILSCLQRLPNLPLVCIDEAHCMAEWGEGFRPAYFRCVPGDGETQLHWLTTYKDYVPMELQYIHSSLRRPTVSRVPRLEGPVIQALLLCWTVCVPQDMASLCIETKQLYYPCIKPCVL